ncbi:amidohydrolase [Desulfopila sp. IMCC35008]|uniref:amidohydrolase n=1 Tax=Desulfopila sp. IMCC35008 TaxID=2653858 RepID=UPI0013D89971|nr:amidohydrolase [Desulfopila sp. IMCC35008]
MQTLFTNATLLTDTDSDPIPHSYLVTQGEHIQATGSMDELDPVPDTTTIDCNGKLLMPGLVNGHNHCAMTLFRGLADDLPLEAWLHDHIFPAEATHANPETVYWCTRLAAAEMILSGTTCVADAYFFSSEAARALSECGMRAVVGHGIVDFPAPSVPDPKKNIEAVALFLDKWQETNSLITPAVFAHAPYTCSPDTLRRAKELADKQGVRFFTHLAESRLEKEMIIGLRGDSPLQHLHELNILDENCTLIHMVWLSDRDIRLLAGTGSAVITCPQSNLKLGSGIAPIQKLMNHNIGVGIGTDGCASNNGLDMFREIGMLARLHKLKTLDATSLPARQVLRAATAGGANALGVAKVGKLKTGYKADIIVIDTDCPHLTPFYSPDLLAYAGSGGDVYSAMINGQLVMHERKILSFDLHETLDKVRTIAETVTKQG